MLASFTGRDQGAKYFLYGDKKRFADISAAVKDYVFKIADYQYCVELNEAIFFYKDFLKKNGWPVRSRYRKQVERNIFLVIQHATNEPELMQKTLLQLEQFAEIGETNPRFYPDLHDKISVHTGRPQLFGTFNTCQNGRYQALGGIENIEELDERRLKYKLRTYAERLGDYPETC